MCELRSCVCAATLCSNFVKFVINDTHCNTVLIQNGCCLSCVKESKTCVCCSPLSAGTLTQAIRNFAKSLENWLTSAMCDFPQETVRTKVTTGSRTTPA